MPPRDHPGPSGAFSGGPPVCRHQTAFQWQRSTLLGIAGGDLACMPRPAPLVFVGLTGLLAYRVPFFKRTFSGLDNSSMSTSSNTKHKHGYKRDCAARATSVLGRIMYGEQSLVRNAGANRSWCCWVSVEAWASSCITHRPTAAGRRPPRRTVASPGK